MPSLFAANRGGSRQPIRRLIDHSSSLRSLARTLKSSSVEVSPADSRPAAMSRNSRRMILPLRVFGRAEVKRISAGAAEFADLLGDVGLEFLLQRIAGVRSAGQRDEGTHGLAGQIVGPPDRGRFRHVVVATRADSISIVLSRWPETFNTSSIRPMIQ